MSPAVPRIRSTSNTCATTSRRSTGARPIPDRSCRSTSSPVRATLFGGIRADHRRLVRALPHRRRHRMSAAYRFSVSIMPRDGILDPAGRAVENALPELHADNVHGVRVGRRVELTVEADSAEGARSTVDHWPRTSWPTRSSRPGRSRRFPAGESGDRRLSGLELRSRCGPWRGAGRWVSRSSCGTSGLIWSARTRSSCRAASPTAITSGRARSRASHR